MKIETGRDFSFCPVFYMLCKGDRAMSGVRRKKVRWWLIPVGIVALLIVTVVGYVLYVVTSYGRIEDKLSLDVDGKSKNTAFILDKEYTAVLYNIGFGAYTPDYTFFMDGGTQSWAKSKESVIDCINGDIALLNEYQPDVILLQEVDFDSTRSYHVDEVSQICSAFGEMSHTLAVNYHSPFLFYPLTQPHGASNAGLLTLSNVQIQSGIRRSLPIAEGMSKYIDLDRCYSINRTNVENGRELVWINVHTSAYGVEGDLQKQQLTMLFDDMKAEYEKGNYVICGGDFNHDFTGNSKEVFNETVPEEYTWAAAFPDELIPEHFGKLTDYAGGMTTPSCRNADKPYDENNFTLTVDGFIVSDNVIPSYMNVIDNQFLYSDHNPVELKFKLQ